MLDIYLTLGITAKDFARIQQQCKDLGNKGRISRAIRQLLPKSPELLPNIQHQWRLCIQQNVSLIQACSEKEIECLKYISQKQKNQDQNFNFTFQKSEGCSVGNFDIAIIQSLYKKNLINFLTPADIKLRYICPSDITQRQNYRLTQYQQFLIDICKILSKDSASVQELAEKSHSNLEIVNDVLNVLSRLGLVVPQGNVDNKIKKIVKKCFQQKIRKRIIIEQENEKTIVETSEEDYDSDLSSVDSSLNDQNQLIMTYSDFQFQNQLKPEDLE